MCANLSELLALPQLEIATYVCGSGLSVCELSGCFFSWSYLVYSIGSLLVHFLILFALLCRLRMFVIISKIILNFSLTLFISI
jgi:hypothetical protein